eukprot:Opistho-2@81262
MAARVANEAKVLGFIGLGNMGAHMARNLRNAGHSVVVYDVNPDAAAAFRQENTAATTVAGSPADVAAAATGAVITMLPSSPHVREVYEGPRGIFSGARRGGLLVDASTIDIAVARDVCRKAADKGLKFVDAPVSGGVGGAQAGSLTFMVGGDEPTFAEAQSVLRLMGKNIVHCGPSGNGQVAKLCNNMLLGISMVGVSEAMNLGERLGMDTKLLAGILNTSSGRCWSSDTYNPCPGVMPNVPSSRDYEGGFGSALMAKDLGLAAGAAADCKAPIPLGALALQLYNLMCAQGYSKKDFSAIFKFLQQK